MPLGVLSTIALSPEQKINPSSKSTLRNLYLKKDEISEELKTHYIIAHYYQVEEYRKAFSLFCCSYSSSVLENFQRKPEKCLETVPKQIFSVCLCLQKIHIHTKQPAPTPRVCHCMPYMNLVMIFTENKNRAKQTNKTVLPSTPRMVVGRL